MPTTTMQQLYRVRLALLVAGVLLYALSFWLVLSEVLWRLEPSRTAMILLRGHLGANWGNLLVVDTGLTGVMGIWGHAGQTHAWIAGLAFVAFLFSVVGFIRPGAHWRTTLNDKTPPSFMRCITGGLAAAVVTVGYIAMTLQLAGAWMWMIKTPWPIGSVRTRGLELQPTFWLCLVSLAGFWAAWTWFLKRRWMGGDPFIRMIVLSYGLFVASGVLAFLAGMLQLYKYGIERVDYVNHGTYTALILGLAGMLWTGWPAIVLIYYGEYYRFKAEYCCTYCGYSRKGAKPDATTCTECGRTFETPAQVDDEAAGDNTNDSDSEPDDADQETDTQAASSP